MYEFGVFYFKKVNRKLAIDLKWFKKAIPMLGTGFSLSAIKKWLNCSIYFTYYPY